MHPGLERERGPGVPQAMESQFGQTPSENTARELSGETFGVDRIAVDLGEDQVVITPTLSHSESLLKLTVTMTFQSRDSPVVEVDSPGASGRLGCAELDLVVHADDCLTDRRRAIGEIQVSPAKAECFTSPHSGRGE